MGPQKQVSERFWSKVDKSGDCWLWTSARNNHGYGVFTLGGRTRYAHRLAYEWANGLIPQGMVIDHMCHVPSCVNLAHLRTITQKQNMENRAGAQRNNSTSGIRGVYWQSETRKWHVQAWSDGRSYSGGLFVSLTDAENAAIKLRNRIHTHNDLDRVN